MKIETLNLCKNFGGQEVLKDLSLKFVSEQPCVISGPSGIGKTTLLRIIEGLEAPSSGEVKFSEFGNDKPRFAPVFQDIRLIPSLTAAENIKLASPGKSIDEINDELSQLIDRAELSKKVSLLSGGTQRRVEICRAVLAPSDVLIMDEPLTGLDKENISKVASYIQNNIGGRIFIVASHLPAFDSFCRKIILD